MKKKSAILLVAVTAFGLLLGAATACGETKPTHTHTLFDIAAQAATCSAEGNIAYRECLYCKKKLVDGKEAADSAVVLAVDPDNHVDLKDIPATAATCVAAGNLAYRECSACNKILLEGREAQAGDVVVAVNPLNHTALTDIPEEAASCLTDGVRAHKKCLDCGNLFTEGDVATTEKELAIKAVGEHTFSGDALECVQGDAYKMLYEGDYYVVDDTNGADFIPVSKGIRHTSSGKQEYFDALLAERMTFSTQVGDADTTTVETDADAWKITHTSAGVQNSFTRFAVGDENGAYIGKFIMTFDVKVSADAEIGRLGAKIVNGQAGDVYAGQSKLLGTNASEENNSERKLDADVAYRFVYTLETTAADQLIQIYVCTAPATVTLSDVHIVKLTGQENKTGCRLVCFDKAADSVVSKADCAHEFAYVVEGTLKKHCRRCGEDVSLLPAGHVHQMTKHEAVAATCLNDGNVEYYSCADCGYDFADSNGDRLIDDARLGAANHNYGENNVCKTCGASAVEIKTNEKSFGTVGAEMNPSLVANPGTWACQTSDPGLAAVKDNVLAVTVNSHTAVKKKTAFVRFVPAAGDETYVGKFLWVFDFKVTQALGGDTTKAKLQVGYFIQSVAEKGNFATIADADTEFEVGVTYRFAVLAETIDANQFVQFNVRNTANSGAKFEIFNAGVGTYTDGAGTNSLTGKAFAQVVNLA